MKEITPLTSEEEKQLYREIKENSAMYDEMHRIGAGAVWEVWCMS